jgi:hypothetical protein
VNPEETTFRIDIRYTLEELAEGVTPVPRSQHGRKWWPPSEPAKTRLMFSIFFAVFASAFFLLFWLMRHPQEPETWELETSVYPSVFPAIYIFLFLVIMLWATWRKTRPGASEVILNPKLRPLGMRIAAIGLGMALGGFLAVGVVGSLPSREPTSIELMRSKLVFILYAPWLLNFIVFQTWFVLQRRWGARHQWVANPSWHRPKTLELDARGFRMIDPLTRLELAWSCIPKVREADHVFVLIAESGLRYLIPKRALAEPELTRLRVLLQNSVKDCEFTIAPEGFAVLPKPVEPLPSNP